MLIESKIKFGHGSMFNIRQANYKNTHLLNKMDLGQSKDKLQKWTWRSFEFFGTFKLLQISKYHSDIIWGASKVKQFYKFWEI